jgi:hypothetical protein
MAHSVSSCMPFAINGNQLWVKVEAYAGSAVVHAKGAIRIGSLHTPVNG